MSSLLPIRSVRMDDELFLKLKEIAKSEDRSFNKQVNAILKDFVKTYEKANGEIKVNPDDLYE